MHGVEVGCRLLKQHRSAPPRSPAQVQTKPVEPARPTLPSATTGDAPAKPLTKRQRRSAQRLKDFQEKKRAAAVEELVASGCELITAQGIVGRAERKRLEQATESCAVPMEAEACSVEGRPPGNEGLQHSDTASSKRVRMSPPEGGQCASRHEAVPQGGRASEATGSQ